MNQAYVSDFAHFMDQYLRMHPEVVEEQQRGYNSFWKVQIDPAATHYEKDDIVRDDQYGFH